MAPSLHEAGKQHAEAHAQEVVQLQESIEHYDGQEDAQRQVAQLLHGGRGRRGEWRMASWWGAD